MLSISMVTSFLTSHFDDAEFNGDIMLAISLADFDDVHFDGDICDAAQGLSGRASDSGSVDAKCSYLSQTPWMTPEETKFQNGQSPALT